MGSNKGQFSLIASIDDPKSYSIKWFSYSLGTIFRVGLPRETAYD